MSLLSTFLIITQNFRGPSLVMFLTKVLEQDIIAAVSKGRHAAGFQLERRLHRDEMI